MELLEIFSFFYVQVDNGYEVEGFPFEFFEN